MNFPIDESSLFTSQHLYKAALVFAVVRWIISWILRFNSDSQSSRRSISTAAKMIRESLELTTCGELSSSEAACAVCLNRMEEEDAVRKLRCCHVFHAECLDRWIEYDHEHVTCPLCRDPLGVRLRPVQLEPSWAVERMLYIFGEDDNSYSNL